MASRSWVDIQQNTFTRWVNEHLKDRGLHVDDLIKDLNTGVALINLVEIISGKSVGKWNKHPRVPFQKLENNVIAIGFLQSEGVKLVNISAEDICDGRHKLILGLIWTLILRYQINKIEIDANSSAKNELLKWVQSKVGKGTPYNYEVNNFQKDWNDGKVLTALLDALQPGLGPEHKDLQPANSADNCQRAIDKGYDKLGVPKLVLGTEMAHPKCDELAMMTYISYYRDLGDLPPPKIDWAGKVRAYGPGLVEAIQNEEAPFCVELPDGCPGKLDVKVFGPKDPATVKINKLSDVKYDVSYMPTEPGEYKVHITLDDEHIPGSIFTVTVLEDESLGGEGKIRVYYSTTSAKGEKTRPLQELLMEKGVHLRPDFEPWIPVDLMEPKDRDAVFKKAGTKNLPIVYVDDVYIGDQPKMAELAASGELDKVLAAKKFEKEIGAQTTDFVAKYKAEREKQQLERRSSAKKRGAPVKIQTDARSD